MGSTLLASIGFAVLVVVVPQLIAAYVNRPSKPERDNKSVSR